MARLPKSDPKLTCIECLLKAMEKNEKETDSEELKRHRLRLRRHLFDQAAERVVELLKKTDPYPKGNKDNVQFQIFL
jgi:uncharacterized protein HemY